MKIIIELRDKDSWGEKQNNEQAIKDIINMAKKYWNCESIEVKD